MWWKRRWICGSVFFFVREVEKSVGLKTEGGVEIKRGTKVCTYFIGFFDERFILRNYFIFTNYIGEGERKKHWDK